MPIIVVGLDVTNSVAVTAEFVATFARAAKSPAALFWKSVLADNDWFIDSGEYYFWDVLAGLVAVDSTLCGGSRHPVSVAVDPIATGTPAWTDASIPDVTTEGVPRRHFDPASAGVTRVGGTSPEVTLCRTTEPKRVRATFLSLMNRH